MAVGPGGGGGFPTGSGVYRVARVRNEVCGFETRVWGFEMSAWGFEKGSRGLKMRLGFKKGSGGLKHSQKGVLVAREGVWGFKKGWLVGGNTGWGFWWVHMGSGGLRRVSTRCWGLRFKNGVLWFENGSGIRNAHLGCGWGGKRALGGPNGSWWGKMFLVARRSSKSKSR